MESARAHARAEEFDRALGDGLNAARALSVLVDALLDGTTAAGERLELVARMNAVLRVGLDDRVLSTTSSSRVSTGRDFQRVA